MIPYFPYSKGYSLIELSYGTQSRAWWKSHVAFSLDQYGIMDVFLVLPAPGFQSFVIIIDNTKVTLNKNKD